jgi:lipoate-protein ligase A
MLWQNHNSVIVGKNQNTRAEINEAFVKAHNISVVRRLSGGGAVYHDMGNLNYTLITNTENNEVNFSVFCRPIQKALISFGIPAEISGRNDMTVDGKKFSGNAMYFKNGRSMHHGTILYDSDIELLSHALSVSNEKIESKGIKSVKSRVTNIRPYMKTDMPLRDFWTTLKSFLFAELQMKEYTLTADEVAEVEKLKERIYSQWTWNYGASPPHNIRKSRRIENCGNIEVLLDVGKEGVINNIHFYGDFFGNGDISELTAIIAGHRLEYGEIAEVVKEVEISRFFSNLDTKGFLSLLF